MKGDIQELTEALRTLSWDLGVEDHCTLGVGLVRFLTKGLDVSFPAILTTGALLSGKILQDPRFVETVIQQKGLPRADEKILRRELESLTDGQRIVLHDQVLELARIVPRMTRGLKSYAATLPSPPGRLPELSLTQCREVCKRILELLREVDLPDAKKMVAREFKLNQTMVNRVWRERVKYLAEPTA